MRLNQASGMRTFTVLWFGQLISLLGTAMTRFALLIWAYQQTGAATTLALLGFFSFIPLVLLSPIAGVIVDRLNRKQIMILTDLGAGLSTVTLLLLYQTDHLQIWHLYLMQALAGAFGAFQLPAYLATTTLLVSPDNYTRINGMKSLSEAIAEVSAPFFAGFLFGLIGIHGIMAIDIGTFLVAIFSLLSLQISQPSLSSEAATDHSSFWRDLSIGFHYIFQRPGLLGLLIIFTGINFFAALAYYGVLPAMILARTNQDELALASVQSALGMGGVVGGLVISFWGGLKRRISNILGGAALSFLMGDLLFAVGRSVPVWLIAAFMSSFFIPFISASNRSIWQTKVLPELQGRVFSVQEMLRQTTIPIGYLTAGFLADQVFEPAMTQGGSLYLAFAWLVGSGPGAGMALMFACTSFLGMSISLGGYSLRSVRCLETDLPDIVTHRQTTGK